MGQKSPAAPPQTGAVEAPQPQASPNDIDGETLFATSCGFCHQSGGKTPGRGPKLAGSQRSDEYIIERIKKGKPGAMPAFGKAFSDGQIIAILAYIRSLDDGGG
jgi:mono/diheme cytochrome c family protein